MRYDIQNEENEHVGFLVITEKAVPTFQHTTNTLVNDSGALGALLLFSGISGVSLAIGSWTGLHDWVLGIITLSTSSAISLSHLWLRTFKPSKEIKDPKALKGISIDITHRFEDSRHLVLKDIKNSEIEAQALIDLCQALLKNNLNWLGRDEARIIAKISRTQHSHISKEFRRQDYLKGKKENPKLTFLGRAFVRRIANDY